MSELSELLEAWDDGMVAGPIVLSDHEVPELGKFKDVTSVLVSGVYILLCGIIIVYVGQARCLSVRIGQHREEKKIKFDGVKIYPCEHKGRRLAMERLLIRKYQPKWNVKHKPAATFRRF
jgi:predicted GIY-YIG superfamily endonuclease